MSKLLVTSMSKDKQSILTGAKVKVENQLLHKRFENALEAQNLHDRIAMVFKDIDASLNYSTYRLLNNSANQIAISILKIVHERKLSPNQENSWIVGCCMKYSLNLITTLLAIWKCGAAYAPIDVEHPKTRVKHIVKDVRPFLIICDDDYDDVENFHGFEAMSFSEIWRNCLYESISNVPGSESLSSSEVNPLAAILYTSGSSGIAKGTRMSHFELNQYFQWQLRRYPFEDKEKFVIVKTALIFGDSLGEIWPPLLSGRSIVMVPKLLILDPEEFTSTLEEFKIQRIVGVPLFLQGLLMCVSLYENNMDKKLLRNLRLWFSSGEQMPLKFVKEFFNYYNQPSKTGQRLINWYGLIEVSCDVTEYEIKSREQIERLSDVPLGCPIDNTTIYIVDGNMEILAQGEIGEICVSGVVVTSGYINDKEPGRFITNPFTADEPFKRLFRTGDFGKIQDGLLFFKGRRDMQIKIRGSRVDVTEIEKRLLELPYIFKSAILVYHQNQADQAVIAFVTLKRTLTPILAKKIEDDLTEHLPSVMIPNVKILNNLPLLRTGKIDRQALLNIYTEDLGVNENSVDYELDGVSRDQIDNAKSFCNVIGKSIGSELKGRISMNTNFFALGGNSLNTVLAIAQLRKNGFEINVSNFLKAETLGEVFTMANMEKRKVSNVICHDFQYNVKKLNEEMKAECIGLLAKSFFNKGDIDRYLPGLRIESYFELLSNAWTSLVEQRLSFMVFDVSGDEAKLLGVALNFDVVNPPPFDISNALTPTFEFLDSIEDPFIMKVHPKAGEIFHAFMYGTSEHLNARLNVALMALIEEESCRIAKKKGFKGLLTTNTNPVTQQFCHCIYGYETVNEVQINQYVDEKGHKPFEKAPDFQKVVVAFKNLQ